MDKRYFPICLMLVFTLIFCAMPSVEAVLSAPTLSSPSNGSSTTDTTPYFDWDYVSGAYYYQIQVDDYSSFYTPVIDTYPSYSYYDTATSLSPGTYYWRVRAYDHYGVAGSWSSTWSFTIEVPFPTLYSPSNYSTTTETKPTFDWNDVSGAYSYEIQVDDSSSFYSPTISTSTYSSSYTPTTSLSSGTYYWRVRTEDYYGNYSDWSSTWRFTVSASVAITFYDSDTRQPIKYKSIYISTDGWSWSYWGQTDSYGQITDTSFDYMGQTVYFRVEQGKEYDTKSEYISSYGGSDSVYVPPSAATRAGRLLPWVLLAVIVIGTIVGGVVYWVKKGKPPARPRYVPTPAVPKPPTTPPKKEVVAKPTPKRIERKLTPEQIESKVYKYLKRHRGMLDVTKCAKRLGVSEAEVEKAARSLVAKGRLEEE